MDCSRALVFVIESTLSQPKENEEDEKPILTYIEAVAARVLSLSVIHFQLIKPQKKQLRKWTFGFLIR